MAALTYYTNAETVRSLLGVEALEIGDDILGLPHYAFELETELRELDAGAGEALTQYAAVAAIAAASRSIVQQRYFDLLQLFAAYSIARKLLGSVDMFAPQKIEDGKAAKTRPATQAERLATALNAGYQLAKSRLTAALLLLNPSAAVEAAPTLTTIVNVPIVADPVTGV